MRSWTIFLLLALSLNTSCNYFRNVNLLTSGRVTEKEFSYTFPFRYERGLIIVTADFGGRQADFIFDSGAFDCKLEASLAGSLGYPVRATKDSYDSQGNERIIEVVQMDSLYLGPLEFEHISAGKLHWDSLSASPCLASGGIIGANLIKLANWKIDYRAQQIHVSSEPFAAPEGSITLPFKHPLLSGTPEVDLTVGGRELGPILIDLGSNGSLRLPYSIHEAFSEYQGVTYADRSNSGIYGVQADTVVSRKIPLDLGDGPHEQWIHFEGSGSGLLGNEVLENYTLILNYRGNEAILQPYPDATFAAHPPLTFIPGVADAQTWQVNRALLGGPLALGDTFPTLNGETPDQRYPEYCHYFLNIGQDFLQDSVRITLTNGESLSLWPYAE